MTEIWLRANRRAMFSGLLVPLALLIISLIAVYFIPAAGLWWILKSLGILLATAALLTLLIIGYWMTLPRLAYRDDGYLLLYLQDLRPIELPVEAAEVFFQGQSESLIPDRQGQETKATAVVVRLAEAKKEWHRREVRSHLGKWEDGYITIRGTWCEPLTPGKLNGLNKKLAAAHREQK